MLRKLKIINCDFCNNELSKNEDGKEVSKYKTDHIFIEGCIGVYKDKKVRRFVTKCLFYECI